MKTKDKMEKTDNNSINMLLLYNLKLEERTKELKETAIVLTRRVKKLEETKKEAKNDSMFVVGKEVQ
eukprot:9281278-Ditylum_brightwellii.AAC.1